MADVSVNDALIKIGEPRKYQFYILFWSIIVGALTSMQSLVLNFTQADMAFRCEDDWMNHTVTDNSTEYSGYPYDTCPGEGEPSCSNFVYNSSVYTNSVKSEFDLVCDRRVLATISDALFMLVRIPAGFSAAQFSDRLGRKKTIMICLLLLGAFGLGTAYAVNIYMYIVFHSLLALPVMGCYDSTATLISEVTSPRKRPAMLIAIVFSWATGIMFLSVFGYFLRDWRTLQMAISIPPFAMLIASYWIYDESPHWLYSQGRIKEAQQVLDKMAMWNNCKNIELISKQQVSVVTSTVTDDSKTEYNTDSDYSQEQLTPEDVENPDKNNCLQMVRSSRFCKIFLVCGFGWLACSMGYTGLAFGLDSLAGDPYINNLISGCTEYISYFIAFLIIPGGRKKVYVILLLVGGVALITNAAIGDIFSGMTWLIILLTMIGRLSVSACWQILYLWCIELFPTTFRLTMLEVSMFVGHIGSAAAPFVNDAHKLIGDENVRGKIIAPSVYGIFLILSSLLSLYLPETNNKALPVNMQEATENMSSKVSNRRVEAGVRHDERLSTYI